MATLRYATGYLFLMCDVLFIFVSRQVMLTAMRDGLFFFAFFLFVLFCLPRAPNAQTHSFAEIYPHTYTHAKTLTQRHKHKHRNTQRIHIYHAYVQLCRHQTTCRSSRRAILPIMFGCVCTWLFGTALVGLYIFVCV